MNETQNSFCLMLEKIAEVHRSLLWETAKVNKISPIQIQIMLFLYSRDKVDTSIKIISNYFNLKAPTISESIKTLVKKNYINMYICGYDKRIHCYKLTGSGKKKTTEIKSWNASLIEIFNKFDEEEKKCMLRNLHNLVYQLKSDHLISGLYFCQECYHFNTESLFCERSNISLENMLFPVNCHNFLEKETAL